MALSFTFALELLQLRRDSALSSSNALSENAQTSLRSDPMQSSDLFGGLIEKVSSQNLAEHQLMNRTS